VLYPSGRTFAPFGIREEEWIKHLLIVGMTGSGKTNLGFLILRELWRHHKPTLVFDWKRNYRDLLQLPEMREARVYTIGRDIRPLRFNPLLPPPGTQPGEWIMRLVDVIKHAYFVGEGVEYLLREAIDRVYQECGLFEAQPRQSPNFFQVRAYVTAKRLQGRMSLWKASAVRVLESLCFTHGLGPVVNTNAPWAHKEILSRPVVLELDALSDADKIFFTEALILWIYELRKAEPKREVFKHALLIEEGHHVLSQAKENHEGVETIMETSLRQIREFGEAVIVIDQEPTKLSNSIKANTYTKFVFNLGNGRDKEDIARCLGLDDEERLYIDRLGVGEAVVSTKRPGLVPLHVRNPLAGVRKGIVTDLRLSDFSKS
jgi:DNA helicase HerA-like ATPase